MTRTERLLRIARRRNDRLAIAVLESDRTFTPDPETPMLTARLCPPSAPDRTLLVRIASAA
jgi:hypothetical protein